ncbi:Disease resistance protein CC-NBS-LRR class family, partial [Prunus dulcis]
TKSSQAESRELIGSIYHQSLWDQPCTYICYTTERLMHLRVSQVEDTAESILAQLNSTQQ